MHCDGNGLYLQVRKALDGQRVTRSWIYRYAVGGRETWLGLGGYPAVSLADARQKALEARRIRADGLDPLAEKRAERAAQRQEPAKIPTFSECAVEYIKSQEAVWRGAKYARQWRTTLKMHAFPIIGPLPVSKIDTGLVMQVLSPIWHRIRETAVQVRGRLELILDWARVHGYRSGENPAAWRGHLRHVLPPRSKVRPVVHHPALPYQELSAFMVRLRERQATAARCLEFVILTACRTNEALQARWNEVDLDTRVWTIPAKRMKAGKEHRVPLSSAAIAVLAGMQRGERAAYIFEGAQSPRVLRRLLQRMRRVDITVHGFRSSFRDWCSEHANFPAEVAEKALGHATKDKVVSAYQRSDMLERRRSLMTAWAQYLEREPTSSEVIPLRSAS
jgi:integrase